jgi:hypothetical protein
MRVSRLPFGAWHISIWLLATTVAVIWIGYLLIGQQLISALYNSQNFWRADRFMAGRASTPVEAYYRRADAVLVHGTFALVLAYVTLRLFRRNAGGLFLFVFSCFVSSFLFFCLFEILVPSFDNLASAQQCDALTAHQQER